MMADPLSQTSAMPSLRQSFDAVVDLSPEARRAWMDRHCPDPVDRRPLEALLAAHASTEPWLLDTPVAAPPPAHAVSRGTEHISPMHLRRSSPSMARKRLPL